MFYFKGTCNNFRYVLWKLFKLFFKIFKSDDESMCGSNSLLDDHFFLPPQFPLFNLIINVHTSATGQTTGPIFGCLIQLSLVHIFQHACSILDWQEAKKILPIFDYQPLFIKG